MYKCEIEISTITETYSSLELWKIQLYVMKRYPFMYYFPYIRKGNQNLVYFSMI